MRTNIIGLSIVAIVIAISASLYRPAAHDLSATEPAFAPSPAPTHINLTVVTCGEETREISVAGSDRKIQFGNGATVKIHPVTLEEAYRKAHKSSRQRLRVCPL